DQEIRRINPSDLAGTPLAAFPSPEVLAGRVVEGINREQGGESSDEAYRLVRPGEASFSREYLTTFRDGDREHSVRIDLVTLTGTVRVGAPREAAKPEAPAPFATRAGLALDVPPLDAVARSMPEVLNRLGVPVREEERPRPEGRMAEGPADRPRKEAEAHGGAEGRKAPAPQGRQVGPGLGFLVEDPGDTS